MRRFISTGEVAAARLPPWQRLAVEETIETVESIFGKGFGEDRGFVVLVEKTDTPEDAVPLVGYRLGDKLESAWRRHGCLIGLTLWGNSGDGVVWVCPERPGYAPQIQELLKREL